MKGKPLTVSLKDPVKTQVVLGTQWGDEGKGKVVDLLGEQADIVARYQGGPNAGHTVKFDGDTFILHHIPTGILRPHSQCIIGNGVVINPESFLKEISTLEEKGIDVLGRLHISQNAHLILPYHHQIEKAAEAAAGDSIGTTGRGIGPAYADKINRIGIRAGDILDTARLREKLAANVTFKNRILQNVYQADEVSEAEILESLMVFREKVKSCISDTTLFLHQEMEAGRSLLIEGAQGTLLDIDFGTYPFVTSSNTTMGGLATGLGISPRKVERIIGVIKAYTTRVGNGPFPTELTGELGEKVREVGGEYGATTGRPRRCGWFDAVVAKYAARLNDLDCLALTKLDVLDALEEIQICTGYQYRGETLDHFPTNPGMMTEIEPIYESMPGWQTPITEVREFDDLPKPTINYLARLEEIAGVPIGIVSVGPARDQTIWTR